MANTSPANVGGSQSKKVVLDTTATDIVLCASHGSMIGSVILQVSGATAGGNSLVPQIRLVGGAALSLLFVSCAYENLATGAEVAAGTAITADGIYAVRLDHGCELAVDYTQVGGSTTILYSAGLG